MFSQFSYPNSETLADMEVSLFELTSRMRNYEREKMESGSLFSRLPRSFRVHSRVK